MEQQLLENFKSDYTLYSIIKNNVFVVETEKKEKRILKTRRKFRLNFVDSLRFHNEYRMYQYLSKQHSPQLNVPQIYEGRGKNEILMDYLRNDETRKLDLQEFVISYLHLQRLEIPVDVLLDSYNQISRGFFYRIFGVSIATLRKKVSYRVCLESLWVYLKLSFSTKSMSRKYWIHGDLNKNNFFYNKRDGQLYFIDFENMFYTEKWPLAEIISKGFDHRNGQVIFDINWVQNYFDNLETSSEIRQVSLQKQFRFALLHHSIHEIAQTKVPGKRKQYTQLLKICLDRKLFSKWYSDNVKGHLKV